jgi:hypothetical protein
MCKYCWPLVSCKCKYCMRAKHWDGSTLRHSMNSLHSYQKRNKANMSWKVWILSQLVDNAMEPTKHQSRADNRVLSNTKYQMGRHSMVQVCLQTFRDIFQVASRTRCSYYIIWDYACAVHPSGACRAFLWEDGSRWEGPFYISVRHATCNITWLREPIRGGCRTDMRQKQNNLNSSHFCTARSMLEEWIQILQIHALK